MASAPPSNALNGPDTMAGRDLGSCVALLPIFKSPLLEIMHWRCVRDDAALGRERHHNWPVLGLTESGASVVHGRLGSHLVEPASVILHQPLAPYRTTHPYGCGDQGCNVALSPALARELLSRYAPAGVAEIAWPASVAAAPPRARLQLFLLVRRLRDGLGVPALALEEAALGLVASVLEATAPRIRRAGPARGETRDAHQDLVERVKAALLAHLDEPVHLAAIAAMVGASPFHLARVFRCVTGLPLHRYLTRLRLLSALPRAAEAGSSLTDLALDLGFSSHSHLTASFRREFGLPPSECRRLVAAAEYEPPPRTRSA